MPTYEFHCKACGYTFEMFASIQEKERREREKSILCEKCGDNDVEQLFGGFSILTGTRVRQIPGGRSSCCGDGNCC